MKHLILFCALAWPTALHAQTVRTWTAAAGTWSTAGSWSPIGVPGTLDSVSIISSTSVTLDEDANIASLGFSGGSLLGQAGNPRSITLSGQLGIGTSGAFLGGTAPITITANGGMSHATVASFDNLTLNLPGDTTFVQNHDGGGQTQGRNGAVINNAGIWNATNTSGLGFSAIGTRPAFNNGGTFNRTTSSSDWNCSWAFNNSGTVNANTGTMLLTGGGTSTGGAFNIASGATVKFQGTHSFDEASSISGAGRAWFNHNGSAVLVDYDVTGTTEMSFGTVTFNNNAKSTGALVMSGGTGNFNGTANPTALTISGGEANFAGNVSLPAGAALNGGTVRIAAAKTFTIPGAVSTWNGTILSGGGTFFFNGGGTITTGSTRVDGATLNLAESRTWTNTNTGGGGMDIRNGGVVNNFGTWEITNNSGIGYGGGPTVAFHNSGVFTKKTSAVPVSVNVPFHNTGTVNVQAGTLNLTGGGTQSGAFSVSAGAALLLQGTHTFSGTPAFSGHGTVQFNSNNPLIPASYNVSGGTTVSRSTVTFNNGAGNIGAVTSNGGTANFNGTASPLAITMNSGGGVVNFANDITVPGAAVLNSNSLNLPSGKTAVFNGTTTWNGSTLGGGGTFVMNAGGSTTSGLPKLYGSTLNLPTGQTYVDSYNAGGGSVELRSGAVINNAGTWEYTGDRNIFNGPAPMSSFNNTGTFTKRNNASSTIQFQIPFNNSGTVNASAGTLRMTGQSFTQTAGQLVLNGGSVRSSLNLPLLIQGGSITGAGSVLGGVAVTSGTVKPRGTLAIQDADGGVTKGDLTMTSASTLDVELGGTVGTQYDSVMEQGNVAFARNGQLAVRFRNGFQYSILNSDTFTILTSNANTTGQFSNVSAGRVTTADYKGHFAISAAGTTSVVLSDFQGYPDIDVEQPAGVDLADGAATVNFGLKTIDTPGALKTFTVRNTGAASLAGLALAIDGAHAEDFAVTAALPGNTLAQEGTAEFTVTFTPTGSGPRTAMLHIASNDPNEAPFDIVLTGEGNFAPVLQLPVSPFEVEPVDFGGAPVSFTVTATDFEDDPDPVAVASPGSGSQFNLGDTTVNVTVTDTQGATTTGSFVVRVLGGFPIVAALAPTAVTTTDATVQATVNPNHFATLVKFVLDGNPIPAADVNVPAGDAAVPVSHTVTGLGPGTTHTMRIDAINAMGQWVPSNTITFTTLGGPPEVTTIAPTMITPTKARLTATVNPNHLPTSVAFYAGGVLVGTVNVPAGSLPQTVIFDFQQLIPGQAVTWHAIGTNELAITPVHGGDNTFNLMASDTTIASENNSLYAANTGWISARPARTYGFRTGDTVCSGFLYAASFGWIHAGTGEPANGQQYSNTGSDYGINVLPDGSLRGHAWSGNIGWIAFENTGAPAIDLVTGALSGHAWSGNAGWISLSTAATTQLAILDVDADGISDAWENAQTGGLTALLADHDSDQDGVSDFMEYHADTDPRNPAAAGAAAGFAEPEPDGGMVLTFPTSPTRFYRLEESGSTAGPWADAGTGWFRGHPTGSTTILLGPPDAPRSFFLLNVRPPLMP